MRLLPTLAAVLFLSLTGCAAGFRAGGPNAGVGAGVGVGPAPALYPQARVEFPSSLPPAEFDK